MRARAPPRLPCGRTTLDLNVLPCQNLIHNCRVLAVADHGPGPGGRYSARERAAPKVFGHPTKPGYGTLSQQNRDKPRRVAEAAAAALAIANAALDAESVVAPASKISLGWLAVTTRSARATSTRSARLPRSCRKMAKCTRCGICSYFPFDRLAFRWAFSLLAPTHQGGNWTMGSLRHGCKAILSRAGVGEALCAIILGHTCVFGNARCL